MSFDISNYQLEETREPTPEEVQQEVKAWGCETVEEMLALMEEHLNQIELDRDE
jgi:hypothetical protein